MQIEDIVTSAFSTLDPKYTYIGQDADGTLIAYTHKPYCDENEWGLDFSQPYSECVLLQKEGTVSGKIPNWENNLWKRSDLV